MINIEFDYITFDEFKLLDEYKTFIKENPDVGYLKVNVYTAGEVVPLSNTNILIMKMIGKYNVLFYNGITDKDGMIEEVVLPSPPRVLNNYDIPLSTNYELSAIHLGYEDIKQYSINIYGNTKVIQYVRLIPSMEVK